MSKVQSVVPAGVVEADAEEVGNPPGQDAGLHPRDLDRGRLGQREEENARVFHGS